MDGIDGLLLVYVWLLYSRRIFCRQVFVRYKIYDIFPVYEDILKIHLLRLGITKYSILYLYIGKYFKVEIYHNILIIIYIIYYTYIIL